MGAKKYPEEFRRVAVGFWRASDRPRCQIAESLGISGGTLVAGTAEVDKADAPGALNADERADLVRLRIELVEVKQEREILKKAAQYFAKETTR